MKVGLEREVGGTQSESARESIDLSREGQQKIPEVASFYFFNRNTIAADM